MAEHAVIVDALRTPIGLKKGALVPLRMDEITAGLVGGLLARHPDLPAEALGDLVLGCAFPEGAQGMLAARGVALLAGLPPSVPARVINRFCGSSMDACHAVSRAIECGDMDCGLAVGMEDMFAVPMGGFNPDFNPRLAADEYYMGMGETAENLAGDLSISREDQEAFAVASHEKALAAQAAGRFEREVLPVRLQGVELTRDEGPRKPDLQKIRSLDPAFREGGTITAATSSPVSKGAAGLLIASRAFAVEHGLPIRAEIVSRALAGVEPTRMGAGPLPASEAALARAGLGMDDLDAIELNEAFAAQSLYVIRKGGWPQEKINLFGGAIAMGHPLGASGARILCTLLNVLETKELKTGLATMCIGGGQGIATILQRPDNA